MDTRVTISAGTAFKVGFFAFFGSLCAYLVIMAILAIPFLLLGGAALLNRQW